MKKNESLPKRRQRNADAFNRLIEVVEELREKCPWDKTQTWDSIRPNTLEETYELLDAIGERNMPDIQKELGDVLLHVLYYSTFAREEEKFDIADVCDTITEKMKYRHPNIYGKETGVDDEKSWEELKQKEKDGNKTLLSGVPATLPSLIKAYRIQDKARHTGFMLQTAEETQANIQRLSQEIGTAPEGDKEKKFGQLMFQVLNMARLEGVNPEVALEKENRSYITHYNHLEAEVRKAGKKLKEMSQEEKMKIWGEKE